MLEVLDILSEMGGKVTYRKKCKGSGMYSNTGNVREAVRPPVKTALQHACIIMNKPHISAESHKVRKASFTHFISLYLHNSLVQWEIQLLYPILHKEYSPEKLRCLPTFIQLVGGGARSQIQIFQI